MGFLSGFEQGSLASLRRARATCVGHLDGKFRYDGFRGGAGSGGDGSGSRWCREPWPLKSLWAECGIGGTLDSQAYEGLGLTG